MSSIKNTIKKEKKYTVGGIVIIIFTPLALILGFFIMSKISVWCGVNINSLGFDNKSWLSFWGGYIASIVTLLVLYITTKQTRNIQEENHKNSIKPSVDIDVTTGGFIKYNEKGTEIWIEEILLGKKDREAVFDVEKNTIRELAELKIDLINLSVNAAKNIEICVEPTYESFKENIKNLNTESVFDDENKIIEIKSAGYLNFKEIITKSTYTYRHLEHNRIICHTLYIAFYAHRKIFNKMIESYIKTFEFYTMESSKMENKNLCSYDISLKYQDMELNHYEQNYKIDIIMNYVDKGVKRIMFEVKVTDIK